MNHATLQRSASGRDHTSKKRAARKRQGGRRDSDGLPTSISERMHALETTVHQLTAQLHEERVQTVLDLRIASGLVTRKERNESYDNLLKLPDEAVAIIRGDLLKICSRISNSLAPAEVSAARGGVSYIA